MSLGLGTWRCTSHRTASSPSAAEPSCSCRARVTQCSTSGDGGVQGTAPGAIHGSFSSSPFSSVSQRRILGVARPHSGLEASPRTFHGEFGFGLGSDHVGHGSRGLWKDGSGRRRLKARIRIQSQLKGSGGGSKLSLEDWKRKLPAKRKALYSHSLPCIEAWLQSLGFAQGTEDRAVWNIERADWHAQLFLEVTDLHIRYLRKGPGKLDRDVERKFSYALSREDLENAILGGP